MYKDVYNKQALIANYETLLQQGLYKGLRADELLTKARLDKSIIIQKTSGSKDQPIYIPRTASDMRDIVLRVLQPYFDHYQDYPARVALTGGVSHTEVALKITIENIKLWDFKLSQLPELDQYDPELLSCYPSVMRELINNKNLKFKSLKAIKLGGEPIFPSDIQKILKRFPGILIIEQYGSTEMPAIALRTFTQSQQNNPYLLQSERFEFLNFEGEGWQPIIVKDHFKELIMPIDRFYDTGDEGLLENNKLMAVRRKNDLLNSYYQDVQQLLVEGCENIQIHLKTKTVNYEAVVDFPANRKVAGKICNMVKGGLKRIEESNKLPLIIQ